MKIYNMMLLSFLGLVSTAMHLATADDIKIDLPPLPYAYDALEPHIDTDTMHYHHDKHHLAYTTKVAAAINTLVSSKYDISFIPKGLLEVKGQESAVNLVRFLLDNYSKIPKEFQTVIRNNGGGFINHIEFWDSMTPDPNSRKIPQALLLAINRDFGSEAGLKDNILKSGLGVFGSGWVWLVSDKSGKLSLKTSPNQDRPEIGIDSEHDITVLLAIDVWEHGYYLRYKNNREEYIKNLVQVLNFSYASNIYEKIIQENKKDEV